MIFRRSFLASFLCAAFFLLIGSPVYARTGGTLQCTDQATTTCTSQQAAIDYAKLPSTASMHCVNYGHTDATGYSTWVARYKSHTVLDQGGPSEYILVDYEDVAPNGFVGSCSSKAFFYKPKECSPDDPPLSGGFMSYTGSEPGYQTCSDGCEYNPSSMTYQTGTVDGIKYVSLAGWIPSGASCTVGPNDEYVPPGDSDGDGISDGNDPDPNNPGSSGNTGDNPPSGESNDSGDGSGNGNQSAGGGSCAAPPSSSGDGILAQIAYQTWATRCAIERSKDANGNLKTTGGQNGTGQTPGGGSTDMAETNALLSAIKGFVKRASDFIDGITGEVGGLDTDKGQGEDDLATVWSDTPEEEELDAGGLGWGRACPQLPSISVGGYSGQVDDGSLCTVMQAVGALILLLAYFQAGLIIGRS